MFSTSASLFGLSFLNFNATFHLGGWKEQDPHSEVNFKGQKKNHSWSLARSKNLSFRYCCKFKYKNLRIYCFSFSLSCCSVRIGVVLFFHLCDVKFPFPFKLGRGQGGEWGQILHRGWGQQQETSLQAAKLPGKIFQQFGFDNLCISTREEVQTVTLCSALGQAGRGRNEKIDF